MTTNLETQPRPKLLKDFLQDNITLTNHVYYPEYEESKMYATLHTSESEDNNKKVVSECVNLPRNRSKSRGAAEALGKLLNNTIKAFHASTPLTLQRSVSRRLLAFGTLSKKWNFSKKRDGKNSKCYSNEVISIAPTTIVVVNVKVKDILRWRSFRDLVSNNYSEVVDDVEEVEPLDFEVGSSDDPPMVKNDGEDFITVTEVDELKCWYEGEKWDEVCDVSVASDAHVGPKKDNQDMASEEVEQQSPVSVLESPFRDEVSDEEFLSSFDQSLANMERTKQRLLQSLQLFENLAGVHEDYDLEEDEEDEEEHELREEDNTNAANKSKADLSRGFSWFKRGVKGLEEKIECIKVMDDQRHWGKFHDERLEIGVDLEVEVLNDLLDEVLIDLCC